MSTSLTSTSSCPAGMVDAGKELAEEPALREWSMRGGLGLCRGL